MHIAICDDDKEDRNKLSKYCKDYAMQHQLVFHITAFSSGDALLSYQFPDSFQLIFLDIFMKPITGIETAKTLRNRNYNGTIVFTTISTEFYADGYELEAAHYLIKPIDYKNLSTALDRAVKAAKILEIYIEVMSDRMMTKILLRNIIYIEVYGHDIWIHTTNGPHKVNISLQKLEEMLTTPAFLKCYRSYIVNMDYIQSATETEFILKNGEYIPITKKAKKQILESYMNYILGPSHDHTKQFRSFEYKTSQSRG